MEIAILANAARRLARSGGAPGIAGALLTLSVAVPAQAQIATLPVNPDPMAGWSYAVTPYIWTPTISANLQGTTPGGATLSNIVSTHFGDYISHINFAAMGGVEARRDRLSLMTDLVYLNASYTDDRSHISSVNFGPGPIDVPRSRQLFVGTRLQATVWSLAAAYTLISGEYGNIDAVGGMRLLAMNTTTNFGLTADFQGPDRTHTLSRNGSIGVNDTYVEGVGGVTGRLNLPGGKFYVPFYVDAGGGTLPFTWQFYSGLSYIAADWVDVSFGYRYMGFQSNKTQGVRNLGMSGVLLVGNFRF